MNKWFLAGVLVMFPLTAGAETIKLESGRTIEGEVVEKTDEYIKVDTDEKVWKIRFRYMSDETRAWAEALPEKKQEVTEASPDETPVVEPYTPEEKAAVKAYLDKVAAISDRFSRRNVEFTRAITTNADTAERKALTNVFVADVEGLKAEVRALGAPDACIWHEEFVLRFFGESQELARLYMQMAEQKSESAIKAKATFEVIERKEVGSRAVFQRARQEYQRLLKEYEL